MNFTITNRIYEEPGPSGKIGDGSEGRFISAPSAIAQSRSKRELARIESRHFLRKSWQEGKEEEDKFSSKEIASSETCDICSQTLSASL